MLLATERVRQLLADFALEPLFIEELGWDRYSGRVEVAVDGHTFTLRGIAEKRGMVAFALEAGDHQLPGHAVRRKIERQAARSVHEHLIVYTDEQRTTQVWQWVRREPGRPTVTREHIYQRGQTGEGLIQKLDALAFSLDEEASLTIVDVTRRARAAFDVERVTRRFYDRFKAEHDAFMGFIRGLETEDHLEWYASIMLNRLMFIYFIQKKGFLDGDRDYLRNHLHRMQERGRDQFLSFYRHFLLRLFHEGLGQRRRSSELDALLGRVPYLNGGLFDVHELERAYPEIGIPDEAFERLFDFFDAYQWHLDDRPLRADNEVNPDVLGYIFEKYINQKQMGAYYTKEDITGYITASVILPRLLEKWAEAAAAVGASLPWQLLAEDPKRYIPSALAYGHDEPLPEAVAAGVDNIAKRAAWNGPATPELGLSTETWREVVGRRERFDALRAELAAGEIDSPAALVTANLNIRQFAQDVVEGCESPELLLGIFTALEELTVLDPTCGSGAFLFAALNIVEPLYDACLERMQAFVAERGAGDTAYDEFATLLGRVESHPNRRFFVLKTIVLNNLYGVDIMEEAIEICKLRLFLKLVSQVDRVEDLEPLPDIDFNVRAGNALVGFVSWQDDPNTLTKQIDFDSSFKRLQPQAEEVDRLFHAFRGFQTDESDLDTEPAAVKAGLRQALATLEEELNGYLARQYGARDDRKRYALWKDSHKPFHWFIDFYGALSEGGFDAIIGNPPYVEYRKVQADYTVKGFKTEPCGDLYAFVMERATHLLAPRGGFGMIVPVSVVSTDGFDELRRVLLRTDKDSWALSFAERPSKLFTGVEKRLTIWLGHRGDGAKQMFVSNYRRWFAEERPVLFETTRFVKKDGRADLVASALPKISSPRELELLGSLGRQRPVAAYLRRSGGQVIYYTRKLRYFVIFLDFIPGIYDQRGKELEPSELKEFHVDTKRDRDCLIALLNSSLFFWFFSVYSDVRNVNRREILTFRCSLDEIADDVADELAGLSAELMDDLREKSVWLTSDYGRFGVLTIQSFQPRQSKLIIDKIDALLSRHYGLSENDIDFITNFDFKYRMGAGDANDA